MGPASRPCSTSLPGASHRTLGASPSRRVHVSATWTRMQATQPQPAPCSKRFAMAWSDTTFRYGLFTLDDLTKQVRQLSTGQRRKLQIARLVAERANVLILDEPTNHLSFDILEAFEQALLGFDGPILAASHDRRFIQRFGGTIWHLDGGKLALTAAAVHSAPVTQRSA
ncbi:MAG: hypothetical protein DCC58_19855 [Chloroflexi bacterium]|nr:MAG: hypothetical protein DCC58_19855 [Chloroflexota bacterium]